MGVSPGEFVALTLSAAPTSPPQQPLEGEAWFKAFDEWMREVAARDMYPPGFELDVSREAMYPNGERE